MKGVLPYWVGYSVLYIHKAKSLPKVSKQQLMANAEHRPWADRLRECEKKVVLRIFFSPDHI
jgi:hypothetical protein